MAGEKTEKATPKKRKESRKEGQVARTAELGGWISLLLVTLVLPPVLGGAAERVTALMSACLRAIEDPSVEVAQALMKEASMSAFLALVILGSVVLVLSTVITLAQGGFYIASKMAKPDLKKLNLIQGVKRMFGPQAWWELAKMLIKSALVTGLVYQGVSALMPMIGGLVPLTTTIEVGSEDQGTSFSESKTPSLNLVLRSLRRAVSISASVMRFCFTAETRSLKVYPQFRSHPLRTARAAEAAASLVMR